MCCEWRAGVREDNAEISQRTKNEERDGKEVGGRSGRVSHHHRKVWSCKQRGVGKGLRGDNA